MAIPGQVQNLIVQTANQQVLISWDLSVGATSYIVKRSLDNITFSTIATISGTPLAVQYLDTAVTLATQYFYIVAAASSDGTSAYTNAQSAVPTVFGEESLGSLRLQSQQRADRVNSDFVTKSEWNMYINKSMYELYDLLVTVYEDYFIATPIMFTTDGSTMQYALPNGSNTFTNAIDGTTFTPPPFLKLIGVDMALQTANNAFVTINKFNFADRNNYVFPNTASSIYGVINSRYRVMGNYLQFIPTPSANQRIRMWYIPRLTELLKDTDTTAVSISGWIEYVIVKAAYYALTKEEQPVDHLVLQLAALQKRIEESAANRDAGMPDTISSVRTGPFGNGWGNGGGAPTGGF